MKIRLFFFEKPLAILFFISYNNRRCGMIAKKREVAAQMWQVFRGANVKLGNWRQVTVYNIDSAHCRDDMRTKEDTHG